MNAKRLIAVGGALVLAVVLTGHLSTAGASGFPEASGDVVAGEGCTSILVGKGPTARS